MKTAISLLFVLLTTVTVHGQSVWLGSGNTLQALNENQSQLIMGLSDRAELICRAPSGGAWVHVANDDMLYYYRANGELGASLQVGGLAALAVDASGVVWATRPGSDDVIRWAGMGSPLEAFPVSGVPYGITIDGDGFVWVSCSFSNEVAKLSADGTLLQTTPVGFFPTGISATHDGGVWLAEKQGLRRLDSTGQTIWTDVAGVFPIGVTTDIDGRGWFTCQTSNEVVVVSDSGIDYVLNVAERPLGISAHSDGSVSVLCRLGESVVRFSPTGDVLASTSVSSPGGMGDLTGLQAALVVAPDQDFDGDGVTNSEEVISGTNPYLVPQQLFIRGDIDRNGVVQLTDAILCLDHLFAGADFICLESLDSNADDNLDLGDPIKILSYLFMGDTPPSGPFPQQGLDPAPIPGFPCPQ
ncbi:MAG: hypothetical protein H2076_10405 [Planctomycetes bacterium]|nr:hypothetical protein [Planctomycetota bacterium]